MSRTDSESASFDMHSIMLHELKCIFELADVQGNGFVPYEEFESVLHELSA
jgi:Ca2+-binding EF-hand superfamily protein